MTTQYIQKSNVDITQLDNEWLVLNTDNYTVTTLNEVGGYCWSLLSTIQSIDSIVNAIQSEFRLSQNNDEIKKDVEKFLKKLMAYQLITYVDDAS